MKKLFLTLLAALFGLASCTNANRVIFSPKNDYWLENPGTEQTGFEETLVYTVSVISNDKAPLELRLEKGEYTTHLVRIEYEGTKCYLYETTLTIKGEYAAYDISGENRSEAAVFPFEDHVITKSYFTFAGGTFNYLRSEQNAESTVPTNRNGSPDQYGNRFVRQKYTTSVDYGEKDADVKFALAGTDEEKSKLEKYFNLEDGFNGKIKKYKKRSNFVDSNLLELLPRTFDFDDANISSLTYSFSTIDVLNFSKISMQLAANTPEGSESPITTGSLVNVMKNGSPQGNQVADENGAYGTDGNKYNYVLDGIKFMSVKVGTTSIGSPMSLKYISSSPARHRHYLAEKTTALPYSMGSLVYTLRQINPAT